MKMKTSERILYGYLLVFAGVFGLYAFTSAPGILWQDSGRMVYRIWHNDMEGKLGLAVAHPLYIVFGMLTKCIDAGSLAGRINIMTALFGGVTVANLFLLVRLWLGRVGPALVGAVTLAVSWTFWQNSVMAEVYTLSTALLFGELIMLLQYSRTGHKKYLYLLGLLNGLAISNHNWAIFGLACYGIFIMVRLVKHKIRLRDFGIVVLLWMVGAGVYEYLIIKNIVLTGDVAGTLSSALFGSSWQGAVLNVSVSAKIMLENLIFIVLNFPTPNILLFFVGLWFLKRQSPNRSFANIVIAMLGLYFVFAFRYTVPDRYVFFIPFYCLAAVLIALGANVLFEKVKGKWLVVVVFAFAMLAIPSYFVTPGLAKDAYKGLAQRRQLPYREVYSYFLQPWKNGYHGTERFVDEALAGVEEYAIIYADSTTAYPLLYAQEVQGRRRDVTIISRHHQSSGAPVFNEEVIVSLISDTKLYVVSPQPGYCPGFLLDDYDFVRSNVLWRVTEKGKR
jgi:hypothetical protein